MRVIRPQTLAAGRHRPLLLALSMLTVGAIALELTLLGVTTSGGTALMATTAALGLGVGAAWLVRVVRPDRTRRLTDALAALLSATFDDSYTLVVAPRLPVRDSDRLDGVLVGPAGARILTVRDWEGRYRVRGRAWEFDGGRHGWVRCRTNPSFDAIAIADGVTRWASDAGISDASFEPAVVFPYGRSQIVLEEPEDEIVTSDNAPWWANSIGRVRRLDPAACARILEAVLDAADPTPPMPGAALVDRTP